MILSPLLSADIPYIGNNTQEINAKLWVTYKVYNKLVEL